MIISRFFFFILSPGIHTAMKMYRNEFLQRAQRSKMKELWDNKEDDEWENTSATKESLTPLDTIPEHKNIV